MLLRFVTLALVLIAGATIGQAQPTKAAAEASPAAAYEVLLTKSGGWLLGPSAQRLLELSPELLVSVADTASPPTPRRLPLLPQRLRFGAWQVQRRSEAGFLIQARAAAGPLRYRLELQGQRGRLELHLESEAIQAVAVRAEVLRLQGGPSLEVAMVDRSLRWLPARKPSFASDMDVQRVRLAGGAAQLIVSGGVGLQGLWVRPLPEGRVALELELDHEGNHPFHPLLACVRRQRPIKRGFLDFTLRPAGSRRQLSALLLIGDQPLPMLARFPRGRRAALVLTDHADQSDAAKLEALAFGETGAVEAGRLGPEHPGLVNRGLGYTKSVFLRRVPGYAPQLDSSTYRSLIERLQQSGIELALHSPSGAADDRQVLQKLLPEFRERGGGHTWIDHQPVTNCEALISQGWDQRSRYYSLDLLQRAGFHNFWSAEDVARPTGSLNLLWPDQPATRRPLCYPLALAWAVQPAEQPWLFASSRFFVDRTEVVAALGERALSRLEQEHGLFIAHVYLDTFKAHGSRFSERSLLQRGPGPDQYRLRPEIDQVFQRLAAHQRSGKLWVGGIDALLEHLRGRAAVELLPGPRAGELVVRSRWPRRLAGLTLRLAPGSGPASVDGSRPATERLGDQGEQLIWFDLEPGVSRRVQLRGPFLAPASLLLREVTHD